MNANPSGSRTPPTGGWGRSIARRKFASTKEPHRTGLQATCCARDSGSVDCRANRSVSGERHAKMACRGAPNPMRAAQGRNGGVRLPRHVDHPVLQPLPLANQSVLTDMVRRLVSARGRFLSRDERALANAASRLEAQPSDHDAAWQPCRARDTELAQPVRSVARTRVSGPPRGKGVLAA